MTVGELRDDLLSRYSDDSPVRVIDRGVMEGISTVVQLGDRVVLVKRSQERK